MSFDACDKMMDKFRFLSLKTDGEAATVVFLDEPRPRETRGYNSGTRVVACFPVATHDGLKIWSRGYEDKNRLKEMWEDIQGKEVRIIRHGKPGDDKTTYEYKPKKMTKAMKAVVEDITDEDIDTVFEEIGQTVDE